MVLAAVVALVVLLGAGAFHLFSNDGDSADEARLQAEARKVTLDFWRSCALHDFDTACRLVVPGARFMGKPRFPVCEDPRSVGSTSGAR
ncbi:hypothetical protein IHE55_13785 [Streptomyces pactum]|uniref:Uncharacterized protein n=1 Tax=Streptomyces pactum TaxID=68249 RepID=A0ABS0NL24_9ACTN|nr:hypothetical protein [Streptomyces pactum]MBH5335807.1 hypothetical protein [Streptomyces pactum]